MVAQALGGIGLFLVGMVLVTDGLRAAAGDSLRSTLLRFTGGPLPAMASGALVTAVVQSSSATTVATIGFVGAGLLTFEQALGLIFGANIGTTATGWIVSLLGLKFSVSTVALPLVGVGALVRLFARGRTAHVAMALSGFGIIFVGLDVLQGGMEGLSARLTPDAFPSDTLGGRLQLVGIGALMTTVLQSSSAGVATTLTALHAGTVSLHQAAALVIGINIGTTVTAGLAAIGASTAAKRTAFAHLLFNAFTGVVAFATLPLFVGAVQRVGERVAPGDATVLLAAFHTAFNVLGVALVLPFTRRFAAMVVRVIRHRGPVLTRGLDPAVASQGTLAMEAVRQTAVEILRATLAALDTLASRQELSRADADDLEAAARALHDTEQFVGTLRFATPVAAEGQRRHVSTIHALDHLGQLIDVALDAPAMDVTEDDDGAELRERLRGLLVPVGQWASDPAHPAPVEGLRRLHEAVRGTLHQRRATLLDDVAAGRLSPMVASRRLEGLAWLERASHHLHRLLDRLQGERAHTADSPQVQRAGA